MPAPSGTGSVAAVAPPSTYAPAAAAAAAAAAAPPVAAAPPAPNAPPTPSAADETEEAVAEPSIPSGPISLPELARDAAMRAERAAIQQALDRFRWNRRKAADFLGVSYKTLLNKMKECGISEQQA
jgi:DNA-binding NtrC family response regulator